MAYLLCGRFSAILCLGAALLLGSCCANNVCDCPDEQLADAIELRFKTEADTLTGGSSFGRLDLDTVLIQRSPLPYNPATKPETVTLIRATAHARDPILLKSTGPFGQLGTIKLNRYRYVVQYLTHQPRSKPTAATILVVKGIQLKGSFDGNGCCTCYSNTQKTAFTQKNEAVKDSAFVDLRQPPKFILITR